MPKPFKGVVNVDIRDSVPDWEPYLQPKAVSYTHLTLPTTPYV